jgi:hypothetical protein
MLRKPRDNPGMRFRLRQSAGQLTLHRDGVDPIELTIQRDHRVRVVMTSSGEEAHPDRLSITVETEFDPSPQIVEAFHHLAADCLPPGHLPREEWSMAHDYIDEEGNILDNHIPPMYLMPERLQTFAVQVSRELYEAADAALGVLRWRSRTLGPNQPFSTRGVGWSLEEGAWHSMSSTASVVLGDVAALEVTEPTATELQALLDEGELEPLAHTLLREAWGEQHDHPRSSLLIGVAALEIGVKQYISACVPQAGWLAMHLPAPPVIRIMEEYLPQLDPPGGGVRLKRFDPDLLRLLRDGTNRRNDLIHAGAAAPPRDRLESILLAVRDVLWTLDSARGHSWAQNYVRESLEDEPSVGYRRV